MANVHYVFSYGSNSSKQLAARVQNYDLKTYAAYLSGFKRVFCLESSGWGGSAVASLAPCGDGVVYGSAVQLSTDELALLDRFEGGYRKEILSVMVKTETSSLAEPLETKIDAITYVAGQVEQSRYTLSLRNGLLPSEQYLCAIHGHLNEHWSMDGECINIRTYIHVDSSDDRVEDVTMWRHSGVNELPRSLEALCVEISLRLNVPWKMPITIQEVCESLQQQSITDCLQLKVALETNEEKFLHSLPTAEGRFSVETMDIIKNLLFIS